jgi:hypothetical protein
MITGSSDCDASGRVSEPASSSAGRSVAPGGAGPAMRDWAAELVGPQ